MTAQLSDQKHVKIKYRPREQFKSFHNRKQRWSVLICHRRAGKTVATLNDLIRGAVNECKPEGRYAFIFPQRKVLTSTDIQCERSAAPPTFGSSRFKPQLEPRAVDAQRVDFRQVSMAAGTKR
jgi:hypothetical protein